MKWKNELVILSKMYGVYYRVNLLDRLYRLFSGKPINIEEYSMQFLKDMMYRVV